jgi:hypothetical protein
MKLLFAITTSRSFLQKDAASWEKLDGISLNYQNL